MQVKKITIFNLFVCEKNAHFLLFCIREIFNSINKSKYICVRKMIIFNLFVCVKNEDISSFFKWEKLQFFNFLYVRKTIYFVLFCIRDIFDPINKNKFICEKNYVIVIYHHRIKRQFCIFTHAYIMHITVFIGIEVAFSRRKVGVF